MRARFYEFVRFCLVGCATVVSDALLLFLLVALGLPDAIARILSILMAMQLSYLLNSRFTYRDPAGPRLATWLPFMSSNVLSCCLNYAVFMGILLLNLLSAPTANRLLAIAAATAVSLPLNYWANRRFAFGRGAQ